MIELIKKIQTDKKKIVGAVIVLLFIVYIDFAFVLKSQFRMLKVASPKIAQLKKDIKKINSDLSLIQVAGKGKEKDREAAIKIIEKIAREDDVPLILEEISNLANKREIKLIQIKPVKAPLAKPEVTTATSKLFPLSIVLGISGGYHQFGKFIADLENARYFLAVEELKIMPDPVNYLKQQITLTLKTYVKK